MCDISLVLFRSATPLMSGTFWTICGFCLGTLSTSPFQAIVHGSPGNHIIFYNIHNICLTSHPLDPQTKVSTSRMFFNGSHLCSSSSLLIFSKLLLVLIHLWRLQKYTQHLEATWTFTLVMTFSKFILYFFTLILGLSFGDQWVHDLMWSPITIPKSYSSMVILSSNS